MDWNSGASFFWTQCERRYCLNEINPGVRLLGRWAALGSSLARMIVSHLPRLRGWLHLLFGNAVAFLDFAF